MLKKKLQKLKFMNRVKYKRSAQIIRPRNFLILGVIVLLGVCAACLLFTSQHNRTIKNNDGTYTKTGIVTLKETSCRGEKLQQGGSIKKFGGLCDGGNWLTVDNTHISTGGGALTGEPQERIFDIENIHPGDYIEIRYTKDQENLWTTNCSSCYVMSK